MTLFYDFGESEETIAYNGRTRSGEERQEQNIRDE
jgi:hypothetical protein